MILWPDSACPFEPTTYIGILHSKNSSGFESFFHHVSNILNFSLKPQHLRVCWKRAKFRRTDSSGNSGPAELAEFDNKSCFLRTCFAATSFVSKCCAIVPFCTTFGNYRNGEKYVFCVHFVDSRISTVAVMLFCPFLKQCCCFSCKERVRPNPP